MHDPDQFYTGLIAELYEPLAGGISASDRFIEFVRDNEGPALELCCGTGLPLLDLVEAGLDVEGLDASADMLAVCARKARKRGLTVTLHEGLMQSFRTERKYNSIYIANGSITLLPDDALLDATLAGVVAHLEPGGGLLVDLDAANPDDMSPFIGHVRETELEDGSQGRLAITDVSTIDNGRNVIVRLRYERHRPTGEVEIEERDWLRRVWSVGQMCEHFATAGLDIVDTTGAEHGITQITAVRS